MADYEAEISYGGKRFEVVPYGDGVLPARFAARLSGGDITGEVTLQIRVWPDHGPQIEHLAHKPPPGGWIDATIQRLPVARLREVAIYHAILTPTSTAVTGVVMPVQLAGESSFSPRARRNLDAGHLEVVARIHAEGGRRGTAAVAETFGVSRATASRWVAAARSRGIDLTPAHPGGSPPAKKGRSK